MTYARRNNAVYVHLLNTKGGTTAVDVWARRLGLTFDPVVMLRKECRLGTELSITYGLAKWTIHVIGINPCQPQ
jgi:hypothetical protein